MPNDGFAPPRRQFTSFLLAQVGAHAAARFAERLLPLGYMPHHAGILRMISASPGLSQQQLAKRLGIFASRLVAILDEMEKRGLLERLSSENDRRVYSLQLTQRGHEALGEIAQVARQHQADLCACLSEEETAKLTEFLSRIAAQEGLQPGVHPGYARMSVSQKAEGDTPRNGPLNQDSPKRKP